MKLFAPQGKKDHAVSTHHGLKRRRAALIGGLALMTLTLGAFAIARPANVPMLVNLHQDAVNAVTQMDSDRVSSQQAEEPQAVQREATRTNRSNKPAANPHEDRVDNDVIELAPGVDPEEIRWFDGRPIRPVRTVSMVVTAYSPDERSCGKWADGYTASGYSVWTNGMNLVAADTSILPFGSLVSVPGYDSGNVVPVLDIGGKIKGNRLDVLYPTHERAMRWGVQNLEVTIWEYADGEPVGFRTQHHNHPRNRRR